MLELLKKKANRFVAWYIKGKYHCDQCPYCWVNRYEDGDCDCGCYIKGDIQDTCRLLPPFRFLLGWPRKRKILYWESHANDGAEEWYEDLEMRQSAMKKAIIQALDGYELYCRDNSKLRAVSKEIGLSDSAMYFAVTCYENACHPVGKPRLRDQWKAVLKNTWNAFADKFRPYLPSKKRR